MDNFERFYISQVGILMRENKCLILEFTKFPGRWGFPGGRIDKEEEWEMAFRRELKEEIGFENVKIHDVINTNVFYTSSKKPYCSILRYIENSSDEIALSEEHSQYKWIGEDEVKNQEYIWECIPKMIKKGFQYHKNLK